MTPAEIDAMPAGAELDALVAKDVMGLDDAPTYEAMVAEAESVWKEQPECRWFHALGGFDAWKDKHGAIIATARAIPPYSTSDAAALEVLKLICKTDPGPDWCEWSGKFIWVSDEYEDDPASGGWICELQSLPVLRIAKRVLRSDGETIALAICRAALKAVTAGEPVVGTAEPRSPVKGRIVWSCGSASAHSHETEEEARACMHIPRY